MGKRKIETTFIEGEEVLESPAEEPKKKKKTAKADLISFEEVQAKLTRMFNGLCVLLKLEKRYKEEDFKEESKDISRMAAKYDLVNVILTLLDPIFLILGFVGKFSEMAAEKGKKKKEEGQKKTEQPGQVVNFPGQ